MYPDNERRQNEPISRTGDILLSNATCCRYSPLLVVSGVLEGHVFFCSREVQRTRPSPSFGSRASTMNTGHAATIGCSISFSFGYVDFFFVWVFRFLFRLGISISFSFGYFRFRFRLGISISFSFGYFDFFFVWVFRFRFRLRISISFSFGYFDFVFDVAFVLFHVRLLCSISSERHQQPGSTS